MNLHCDEETEQPNRAPASKRKHADGELESDISTTSVYQPLGSQKVARSESCTAITTSAPTHGVPTWRHPRESPHVHTDTTKVGLVYKRALCSQYNRAQGVSEHVSWDRMTRVQQRKQPATCAAGGEETVRLFDDAAICYAEFS